MRWRRFAWCGLGALSALTVALGSPCAEPFPLEHGPTAWRPAVAESAWSEAPQTNQTNEVERVRLPYIIIGSGLLLTSAFPAVVGFALAATAEADAERINASFKATQGKDPCTLPENRDGCQYLKLRIDDANVALGVGLAGLAGVLAGGGLIIYELARVASSIPTQPSAAVMVMPGGIGLGVTGRF